MSNFQNMSLGEKKQVAKDYILYITFCVRKKRQYEVCVCVLIFTKGDTGKINQKQIKLALTACGW